jgi:2-polyprenyl-3-methyl-5-hydroxy-6-metoxy-1,4-benzoquinol methylase
VSPESADQTARERARNFERRFEGRLNYGYQGIPIFAAPGLHELAAERLSALLPDAHAQVLELGAGAGALSQRLTDLGMRVCASDLFDTNFTPRDRIDFVALDLNQSFAEQLHSRFDAIVALELIEHLENPRHFFRQCRQLLGANGYLVVSTPNLANPVSQAMFLREGVFQWFRETDYREQGHIMPLAPQVLRRCWNEAGFHCTWEGSVSDPYRLLHRRRNRGTRLLARMLSKLSKTAPSLQGEVYIAVLQTNPGANR